MQYRQRIQPEFTNRFSQTVTAVQIKRRIRMIIALKLINLSYSTPNGPLLATSTSGKISQTMHGFFSLAKRSIATRGRVTITELLEA